MKIKVETSTRDYLCFDDLINHFGGYRAAQNAMIDYMLDGKEAELPKGFNETWDDVISEFYGTTSNTLAMSRIVKQFAEAIRKA